jgi:hypothetical protein
MALHSIAGDQLTPVLAASRLNKKFINGPFLMKKLGD